MYKQAKKNIKVIKKEMLKYYCEMCLGFLMTSIKYSLT